MLYPTYALRSGLLDRPNHLSIQHCYKFYGAEYRVYIRQFGESQLVIHFFPYIWTNLGPISVELKIAKLGFLNFRPILSL